MKVDQWIWGRELVIWGYDSSHKYTFKIEEPRKGRSGCLSLQYHNEKSETWLCIRGTVWALAVIDGKVCTWLMQPGDSLSLDTGIMHRMMGASDDVQVAEASTPDAHAADKNSPKDVVRLHCTMGREVSAPRNKEESDIVKKCVEYTEEAISFIERGEVPPEHDSDFLKSKWATRLWL